MGIYLSGIRDQLRCVITTTGLVGKVWLNRAVTLVQPAKAFIQNNLKQTGILAASNMAMLVISEKIVSRIDTFLPHQAVREGHKRSLMSRSVQVLVTGSLVTGLNVALNRALQLKFNAYLVAVITTVSVASSILWQELKGRRRQQQHLSTLPNPIPRAETGTANETVYMTTGDSPATYSRSSTPRIPTPRDLLRRLSSAGEKNGVQGKPVIPPLNFKGIRGEDETVITSKELPHSPQVEVKELTPSLRNALLINASPKPVDEKISSLSEIISPSQDPSQTRSQPSPKRDELFTQQEAVLTEQSSARLSPLTTPGDSQQLFSSTPRGQAPVQPTNGHEMDIASSMQEKLETNDEQVNPEFDSRHTTPREMTPREDDSQTISSNQTMPQDDEYSLISPYDDEEEELQKQYANLGTSIESRTQILEIATDPNCLVTVDSESVGVPSAFEDFVGSSHSMPVSGLPVNPIATSIGNSYALPLGAYDVDPVSMSPPIQRRDSTGGLSNSTINFDELEEWMQF